MVFVHIKIIHHGDQISLCKQAPVQTWLHSKTLSQEPKKQIIQQQWKIIYFSYSVFELKCPLTFL